LGYALTDDVGEKALFCLVGRGNNGKATLLEAFRYVFGDYAGQIVIESLLQKTNNNSVALADLADLKGKRFVSTSEAEQGAKLAEAQVKQLTGMGTYKACRKYENPIEFQPTWKIFMDSNFKPLVRGNDTAIWNRLKLISFHVEVKGREIDKGLLRKLKREAPGLLRWALQGCLDWQRDGLQEPVSVRESVASWRSDSDPFRGFFGKKCELGPHLSCLAAALLKAFRNFKKIELLAVSERDFALELKRLACTPGRKNKARF
jgi:putative DNA primase/helicase